MNIIVRYLIAGGQHFIPNICDHRELCWVAHGGFVLGAMAPAMKEALEGHPADAVTAQRFINLVAPLLQESKMKRQIYNWDADNRGGAGQICACIKIQPDPTPRHIQIEFWLKGQPADGE